MNNPHLYYFTEDESGQEWRILIAGEYEKFPDGSAIVADLEAIEYRTILKVVPEEEVPEEILAFVDSLLDDKDTALDIQRGYEEEGQHLIERGSNND